MESALDDNFVNIVTRAKTRQAEKESPSETLGYLGEFS